MAPSTGTPLLLGLMCCSLVQELTPRQCLLFFIFNDLQAWQTFHLYFTVLIQSSILPLGIIFQLLQYSLRIHTLHTASVGMTPQGDAHLVVNGYSCARPCAWLHVALGGGEAASGILRSSNYDLSRALPRRNKVIMPSGYVGRVGTVSGRQNTRTVI